MMGLLFPRNRGTTATNAKRSRKAVFNLENLEGRQVLSTVHAIAALHKAPAHVQAIDASGQTVKAQSLYKITINLKNEVNQKVHVVIYDHLTLNKSDKPTFSFDLKPGEVRSVTYNASGKQTRFEINRIDSSKKLTETDWPPPNIVAKGKWYYNAFIKSAGSDKVQLKAYVYPA